MFASNRKPRLAHRKSAFTLVELLVVITIIGILIALLLPAVQAAREAARRAQCTDNEKQLALGCLGHESATGRFPTGGWGFGWTGDADRGNDWRQPGGWIYNILPFIEQQALHDIDLGLSDSTTPTKNAAHLQQTVVPLSVLYCPTRRPAIVYPWRPDGYGFVNADMPTVAAREDYGCNGGETYTDASTGDGTGNGPFWGDSYENRAGGPLAVAQIESPPGQMTSGARSTFAGVARVATGIVYCGSLIRAADVTDGLSNTYLLGEKALCPDNYANGLDPSDNEGVLGGDNADRSRWSGTPPDNYLAPMQDTPGYLDWQGFGSAHSNGFHMAFCDGAVQFMSYTIDPETHRRLCNRKDDLPVDPKRL
jgi:prepilin-type N-terminal cleavage/methylation domain-containing protein/prepilin-type processing-associated H-X9-DG protein